MPEKSNKKEKKEFLRREDIRTMEKDLLRLKEKQAKEERERVSVLKTGIEIKKEKGKEAKEIVKKEERPKEEIKTRREGVREREEEEEKKLVEEIERKWLEEKERREKEETERKKAIKEKILSREKERQNLEKEKTQIEVSLQELPLKKGPLQNEKKDFLEKIEQLKSGLQPILEQERKIEGRKKEIEIKERKAATPEKRREAEQTRWQVEQERQKIEERKWAEEEAIEKTNTEIKATENEIKIIFLEEKKLQKRQEEIIQREKEMALEEEKTKLEEELAGIQKEKTPLEEELDGLSERRKKMEEKLANIARDEKSIEEEIRIVEEREAKSPSVEERKEIEKGRWGAEKERTEIEKERWNIEEKKSKIDLQIKEASLKHQRIKNKGERIKERIKEIENILIEEGRKMVSGKEEKPPEQEETSKEKAKERKNGSPKEELADEELIKKAQERLEKIRNGTKSTGLEKEEKFVPIPKKETGKERRPAIELAEEKLIPPLVQPERKEKKSIIEPIKKIIISFKKEKEAKEEKEEKFVPIPKKEESGKIRKKIRTDEMRRTDEKQRREFLERIDAGKEKMAEPIGKEPIKTAREPSVILKPLPKRPSSYEKIFIRFLVLITFSVILVGSLFFGYWLLTRKPPPPEKITPPEEIVPPEETPASEEITIPPSPFSIGETKTFEIFEVNEISSFIEKVLTLKLTNGEFTRLVFRDMKNGQLMNLADLFSAFQIQPLDGFYSKTANNEIFFIWTQKEGKRFGFLIDITEKEAMENLLRLWEADMEENFEELFRLLGKTEPASRDYFVDLKYKGIASRCQTFTKDDLGICYLVTDQFLIWTSSFESMTYIIEEIMESLTSNNG
ncbi:hypothetical protein LCGC14_0161030 [marine sediment metagenome]|uniref:Uncharacterized protein n=1 Tax=marine sediment metagenome TaxID=412755 RepID=A0A0F9UVR1_9ZZZZ|nr:hypothetical protein [Candidatus Nealsonbacteria bacterium]